MSDPSRGFTHHGEWLVPGHNVDFLDVPRATPEPDTWVSQVIQEVEEIRISLR